MEEKNEFTNEENIAMLEDCRDKIEEVCCNISHLNLGNVPDKLQLIVESFEAWISHWKK